MSQSEFRAALLDGSAPVPPGLTDPMGRPAGKRFDVYRNNVVAGLCDALAASFPVVQKLVGEEFFAEMAARFVRRHPPGSPVLMLYGAAFPAFLESFPPAGALGYLPDIARLELALRRSYHAADVPAVDPSALTAIPPEQLAAVRLTLTPSTGLLQSRWPIHAIWRFNRDDAAPKPVMRPEDVLILRQGFDPLPHLLPAGGADLVAALAAGQTLGAAAETLPEGTDLIATLALLLRGGIHTLTCEPT